MTRANATLGSRTIHLGCLRNLLANRAIRIVRIGTRYYWQVTPAADKLTARRYGFGGEMRMDCYDWRILRLVEAWINGVELHKHHAG
jgi:hypothetical protein